MNEELLESIKAILQTSLDDGLKLRSIDQLIQGYERGWSA